MNDIANIRIEDNIKKFIWEILGIEKEKKDSSFFEDIAVAIDIMENRLCL